MGWQNGRQAGLVAKKQLQAGGPFNMCIINGDDSVIRMPALVWFFKRICVRETEQ
jgi:hypothetical protein